MIAPVRVAIGALLVGLAVVTGGCVSAMLAPKIVTAPNTSGAPPLFSLDAPEARVVLAQTYARNLRVPVGGPPTAEIAVSVIEPGDYHLEHGLDVQRDAAGRPAYYVNTRWAPLPPEATRLEPRGTVILLHGFYMTREAVVPWGVRLAQAGYRSVLVDLRGHGASSGPWVTFGAREVSDLIAVLDQLEREGLVGGHIGVLGVSYGAAIALQWAAADARLATVVALEPFADGPVAIRQYARAMLSPAVNRTLPDRAIAAATRRAARLAGFAWSEVDVSQAVQRLRVPVLFLHGGADTVIPPEHSRRLCRLAPAGSRLIECTEDDHFSLAMRLEGVAGEVEHWLDSVFTGACRRLNRRFRGAICSLFRAAGHRA